MIKNKIFRNIFSSLSYQLIALIYGFIVPRLIIGHFGSDTNGLVSSISQFLSYITLLEVGIGPIIKNALFKPIVEKNTKDIEDILGTTDRFFKKIAYVFVIYLIILCILYPFIVNDKFSFLYTVSLILIISISRFFEYFMGMTYKAFIQSDQKNFVIDHLNSITHILNLILIVILIKLDCSIQIVKLVGSLIYIIRPWGLKLYFDKNYGYTINKQSKYNLAKKWDGLSHHIAAVVQNNTDVVVLTIFSNLINVSIYSVYALVTNGVRSIIISFTNGIDAFFGKLMINNDTKVVKQKFDLYSFVFYTVTTILLSCSLILIIPFINVYTAGIHDANYVQPLFAYLIIFAEFSYVIRYPFSTIVYAKGHFKETKTFSIIEPIVNIILSILLVNKYGLIGVAIGTLISMLIRSLGFIVYASKNILDSKIIHSLKMIIISLLEMIIFFIIHLMIGNIMVSNYLEWLLLAIIVFVVITFVTIFINIMFNKEITKRLIDKFRKKKVLDE